MRCAAEELPLIAISGYMPVRLQRETEVTNGVLFSANLFWQRFRIPRHLFDRQCKKYVVGKLGFSFYHKCTAAVQILAYRVSGDLVDDYMHMSESTCIDAMYKFHKIVDVWPRIVESTSAKCYFTNQCFKRVFWDA